LAEVVFFHLGLHKTATGWLQRQLFPKLRLPVYRTRKFDKIIEIIAREPVDAIIISHEGLGGRISDRKAPGDALKMFQSTLDRIAQLPTRNKVLIGFREQVAWINSAYAQRGKKAVVTPEQYRESYSLDDLLWMHRLELCDRYGLESFLFLYEEFDHDPITLVADMCKFMGTSAPQDAVELLARRENQSPRTERGLHISRVGYGIAHVLGSVPWVNTKMLRQFSSRLGARLDSQHDGDPRLVLTGADAERLREDWDKLVGVVGARRGRYFQRFANPARHFIERRESIGS
jgi:hypothetical protein